MPKLRKMLGDIRSPECIAMMNLIETQSKTTLAAWAVDYAKETYLDLYETASKGHTDLREIITACEEYLTGLKKTADIKPFLKEATRIARSAEEPVTQAAARAIATACATIQTPTNALGFLFYGAAASAYLETGLAETADTYDRLAAAEFKKAFASLQKRSVPDEPNPAKIKWNC